MNAVKNIVLYILPALAALMSCSARHAEEGAPDAAGETPQAGGKKPDLVIAVSPAADCLPFYVAEEAGIYKRLGLDVKFTECQSLLKCDEALEKGAADGAFTTLPSAMHMAANGRRLKIIMATDGDVDIIAARTTRIKRLSDMRERLVAITRHSTSDYLADEIAAITKIPPYEILRPQINDIGIRRQMLANNQTDAAALPRPHSDYMLRAGNIKVFSTQNSGIKFGCIAVADTALKTKPAQIGLLVKGYGQAAEYINKDRRLADSILAKRYGIPPETLDSIPLPKYLKAQGVKKSDYDKSMRWCISRKYAPSPIPAEDITTSKFIAE